MNSLFLKLFNTGVGHTSLNELLVVSDRCIVGSSPKITGDTWQAVDPEPANDFMKIVKNVRGSL
tara:strand:- start:14 stop:205 length:192 start_codon:yes stop_codon:yes gene_type:complete